MTVYTKPVPTRTTALWRRALHESGHALRAIAVHEKVTVERIDARAGVTKLRWPLDPMHLRGRYRRDPRGTMKTLRAMISVVIAGSLAEGSALQPGDEGRLSMWRLYYGAIDCPPVPWQRLVREVEKDTRTWCVTRQKELHAMADALCKKPVVDGVEFVKLALSLARSVFDDPAAPAPQRPSQPSRLAPPPPPPRAATPALPSAWDLANAGCPVPVDQAPFLFTPRGGPLTFMA
jgi:hypothetical protein